MHLGFIFIICDLNPEFILKQWGQLKITTSLFIIIIIIYVSMYIFLTWFRTLPQACDSGLSVGTEPDGDTVSDGSGLLPTPGPPLHFHQHHNPTLRPGKFIWDSVNLCIYYYYLFICFFVCLFMYLFCSCGVSSFYSFWNVTFCLESVPWKSIDCCPSFVNRCPQP